MSYDCVFLYFKLKCIIWMKYRGKVHIKSCTIYGSLKKSVRIGAELWEVFNGNPDNAQYNLIRVIKFIFPRLKLHDFECVFRYFQLKCKVRMKFLRKVHIKLYNIWKFEKIGQNRGWVMRSRFITATRITF
jgi:hypothetical protein